MRSTSHSPSTLHRSRYDYYYPESPPSAATNYYENQHSSLFGDPVPPSTGFIENLDNHLYGSLRRFSVKQTKLDEPRATSPRFISQPNSTTGSSSHIPPPSSGGGSGGVGTSSGILRDLYRPDSRISSDYNNFLDERSHLFGDKTNIYNFNRVHSAISNDFRANLDNFRNHNDYGASSIPIATTKRVFSNNNNERLFRDERQSSVDSRTSNEWMNYRAGLDDWSNIPRPQHNKKNISHISHGMSSESRSSSDEKTRPSTSDSADSTTESQRPITVRESSDYRVNTFSVLPYEPPPPTPSNVVQKLESTESESEPELETSRTELTAPIITNVIMTGSNHRLQPATRLHKKPSFTIINELSPHASRAPSPTPQSPTGRTSPFLGRGFKPPPSHLKHRNSFDSVDHHRAVHFSNSLVSQPRSRSSLALTPRSILTHNKHRIQTQQDIEKLKSRPPSARNSSSSSSSVRRSSTIDYRRKPSFEKLPYATQIPRSTLMSSRNQPVCRSKTNLVLDERLETTNTKPLVNPRAHHKGMVRIVNGVEKVDQITQTAKLVKKTPAKTSATSGSASDLSKRKASPSPMGRRSSSVPKAIGRNRSPMFKATQTPETFPESGTGVGKKKTLSRTPSSSSLTSGKVSIQKKLQSPGTKPAPSLAKAIKAIASNKKNPLTPIVGTPNTESQSSAPGTSSDKKDKDKPGDKDKKSEGQTSPSKIPVRTTQIPTFEVTPRSKESSPEKGGLFPLAPKSPTKSMLSESIKQKRTFGLASVSKALSGSFRRNKKKDSDTESIMDFQSQLTLKRTDSMMSIKGPATPGVSRFKNPLKRTPSFKNEDGSEKESVGSKKETPVLPKKDSLLKRQISNISILSKNRSHVDPEELAKRQAATSEEKEITLHIKQSGSGSNNENSDNSNIDKMVPLTKSNVVSMTTAAITAQPVQISTTVTKQLGNREPSSDELKRPTSAAISKRDSQKTLDNLSKSDSKESKMETPKQDRKFPSRPPSSRQSSTPKIIEIMKPSSKPPTPGSQRHAMEPTGSTTNEKRPSSNNNNDNTKSNMMTTGGAAAMMEQISEKSITMVQPETELESGNYQQKLEHEIHSRGVDEKTLKSSKSESTLIANDGEVDDDNNNNDEDGIIDYDEDEDGDIGHPDGLDSEDENSSQAMGKCCHCTKHCVCCNPVCDRMCMPCNKFMRMPKFLRRNKKHENQTMKSKTSSELNATDDETDATAANGCWNKVNCCKKKKGESRIEKKKAMTSSEHVQPSDMDESMAEVEAKRGKCRLCLDKFFCCKSTNKIDATEADEIRKCCFCIPCRKKKPQGEVAWAGRRDSVSAEPQPNCCSRMFSKLNCCKKKESSRRTSMNSKKQSIAPTNPPEDTRPKLDLSLVEHTSMMKAAIPVLPVCLAWFCGIWNFIIPGSGTIFSGLFCLCIGIPRFSQHDSARARIGSFVINIIVGISQAFCLLFCLVGYGWSAWWGAIMIKTARKHKKIKAAESHQPSPVPGHRPGIGGQPPVVSQNHRDVEAGR